MKISSLHIPFLIEQIFEAFDSLFEGKKAHHDLTLNIVCGPFKMYRAHAVINGYGIGLKMIATIDFMSSSADGDIWIDYIEMLDPQKGEKYFLGSRGGVIINGFVRANAYLPKPARLKR